MGVRQDKLALRKLSLFNFFLKPSQATVPLKDCGNICTAGARGWTDRGHIADQVTFPLSRNIDLIGLIPPINCNSYMSKPGMGIGHGVWAWTCDMAQYTCSMKSRDFKNICWCHRIKFYGRGFTRETFQEQANLTIIKSTYLISRC